MPNEVATRPPEEALPVAVEQALLHGDLAALSVEHRLTFYHARCRASGLNPLAKPFAYVKLNNKVVLYALKECAEQLNHIHGISHTVSGIICDDKKGVIEVMCEATTRDGRRTFEIGAVSIERLSGEALCNAKMKAVTKAKRRATLSLCGLGDMMDESELETVRTERVADNGQPLMVDNKTGVGKGKYESEEKAAKFVEFLEAVADKCRSQWLDRWTAQDGSIPDGVPREYTNRYQLDNHLAKWAEATGLIEEGSMSRGDLQSRQAGRLSAIPWYRSTIDRDKMKIEIKEYVAKQEQLALQKLQNKHPELFEPADADDATQTEDMTDDEIMGDMEGGE